MTSKWPSKCLPLNVQYIHVPSFIWIQQHLAIWPQMTFKWPSKFWPLNVYYMYQASCKSNPIQHVGLRWPSNDLQNVCHPMFTCTKPHVNPTPFSILASDDLQMTFKMFATQCLIHVPSIIWIHQRLAILPRMTFKWPSKCLPLNVYYMYQASCKSNPVQHFGLGWPSNDLQNFRHSMFNTCTKHHLNPTTFSNLTSDTPFSILASDDLQMTFNIFATQCLIHVPSIIWIQ